MKGFAFGSWTRGPLNTTLGLNYVGSYTNNLPITVNGVLQPVRRVPSWTTFDINASLQLPEVGWMKDSVVALSVQNVTDRDPPLVLNGSNAFDVNNANPYGRMFQIELSKSF
jgi:iron complex outermembrane receptor protein